MVYDEDFNVLLDNRKHRFTQIAPLGNWFIVGTERVWTRAIDIVP